MCLTRKDLSCLVVGGGGGRRVVVIVVVVVTGEQECSPEYRKAVLLDKNVYRTVFLLL